MPTPVDQLASIRQNSITHSTYRSDNIAHVTCKSSATASRSRLVEKSSSYSLVHGVEAANKLPSSSTSRVSARSSANTRAVVAQSSPNNNSKSSPVKQRKPPSTSYVYTAVKDIRPGTLVNVFGIVKFVRPASRTRGSGEQIVFFYY